MVFDRLFKKKRKRSYTSRARARRKYPERKFAPVEEIVEQGLLVSNVAARMSVKNTIIMNALRRNVDYDSEAIEGLVSDKLVQLANESKRDANHIVRVRDEIKKYGRSAWQETEFGPDDLRTLKHRQEVYEALSQKLLAESSDADFVGKTAADARDQAWSEIGDSLKERASHPYYSGGSSEEYKKNRDARIAEFIETDLGELLGKKRGRRKKG